MAQGGKTQGGLSNLSSVFSPDTKISEGANYIDDIHASGFTINAQGTDFLGIEGTTYANPGQMWQGIDPEEQSINLISDIHSTGFVGKLQEGDDTLFSGIVGSEFTNPGQLGVGGPFDTTPVDVIDNIFAEGFTPSLEHLSPSLFIGINGTNYANPGSLGNILIDYQQDLNAPTTEGTTLGITSDDFVDVIENIHANGFTWLGPIEMGNVYTTQFKGIDGDVYSNPGMMYEGIEPEFQSVHASELYFSPGFVPGIVEGDDTLFSGVTGNQFEEGASDLGFGGVLDIFRPANFILDVHSSGFTELGPIEEGKKYITQFKGVTGKGDDLEFTNKGEMGFGGVNDEGFANYIKNNVMTGFTPNRAPGTGEIFNSISEFIDAVDLTYENPGSGLGIHYYKDYGDDGTIDHLIPAGEYNRYMLGFTKNRFHKAPSEFVGVSADDNTVRGLYTNPHAFTEIRLNAQQLGLDYTGQPDPLTGDYQLQYAKGFTSYIQDKIDGGVDSEFHMITPFSNGNGTIYDEFSPGSGENFSFGGNIYGNTLTAGEFAPGGPSPESSPDMSMFNIIDENFNQITERGNIDGIPVTELTLKDVYDKHINNLVDWDLVQPKGAAKYMGGAKYDPSKMGLYDNVGGFLPLTFSRTSLLGAPGLSKDTYGSAGSEPYIVSPIGKRKNFLDVYADDFMRLSRYVLSEDGVKFMATQLASGIGAYAVHRGITHGAAGDKRKYDQFTAGLFGGHQQFQYIYNPLSLYSSNIPYVKVRMGRTFLFQDGEYTKRKTGLFGLNFTKNADVDKNYFKDINKSGNTWDFDNQAKPTKKTQATTLGGDIINNVNTSIDGTSINVEGITGDWMTLTPIDEFTKIEKPDNVSNIHDAKHGFPFYFKDLRNNKILAFRGFIEDINENVNANWGETLFIGRSEPVYSYQNTTRDLNFTMKLYGNNPKELDRIYEKLDYLTNLCYPQYFKDEGLGYTRPKPPLTRLRMASLYGGSPTNAAADYVNGVLGFIQSVNYTFDAPWESVGGNDHIVPKYIIANISYKIINDRVPGMDADGNTRPMVPNYGFSYGGND